MCDESSAKWSSSTVNKGGYLPKYTVNNIGCDKNGGTAERRKGRSCKVKEKMDLMLTKETAIDPEEGQRPSTGALHADHDPAQHWKGACCLAPCGVVTRYSRAADRLVQDRGARMECMRGVCPHGELHGGELSLAADLT